MSVYRGDDGRWRYRTRVLLPDGRRERISGTAPKHCNTKEAAKQAEAEHVVQLTKPAAARPEAAHQPAPPQPEAKEVPTFRDWFKGRYWREWVIAQKNSPGERTNKESIFENHLDSFFGDLRLDEIRAALVNEFKAYLVDETEMTSDRSRNNVLTVLSTALNYAVEAEVIDEAPRIRLFRYEQPELEWWRLDEYPRLLASAKREGPMWFAAVSLAGEAGLRQGEIRGLRWREDVDLVGRVVSVNQQLRQGVVSPPKWGSRRRVPMTDALHAALTAQDVIREGLVVRNLDGTPLTEAQMREGLRRICRRAGLPERQWHALRHSFGTHAALLGVNPWRLQSWMGHKAVTTTMGYVHVAASFMQPLPPVISGAAQGEQDPDRRVVLMLGARRLVPIPTPAGQASGQKLAKKAAAVA